MNDNVYKSGWKVAWKIYPKDNWRKNIWRPVILTIVMSAASLLGNTDYVDLMKCVSSWIIGGYPSILGFILSGYVLLIGFCGSDFLLALAKTRKEDKISLFQKVSSTFSIVLLVILSTYGIGALYDFVIQCAIVWPFADDNHCEIYNYAALVILLFAFSYSLCTLFDIVINIFNMGQFANIIAKRKLIKIKEHEENGHERKSLCQIIKELIGL